MDPINRFQDLKNNQTSSNLTSDAIYFIIKHHEDYH